MAPGTNHDLVPGLTFEGGIFNEQQTFVPICPGGERSICSQNQKCLHKSCLLGGARKNAQKKLSMLSIDTWGDRFSWPLWTGHQKLPVRAALANFSILACTKVGTSQIFWPPRGGGGVQGLHLGTPCDPRPIIGLGVHVEETNEMRPGPNQRTVAPMGRQKFDPPLPPPPPPPPPKKVAPGYKGLKIHWGIILSPKRMVLQRGQINHTQGSSRLFSVWGGGGG